MINILWFSWDLRRDNYLCTYLDMRLNYNVFVNLNVIKMVLTFRNVSLHLPKQKKRKPVLKLRKLISFI